MAYLYILDLFVVFHILYNKHGENVVGMKIKISISCKIN